MFERVRTVRSASLKVGFRPLMVSVNRACTKPLAYASKHRRSTKPAQGPFVLVSNTRRTGMMLLARTIAGAKKNEAVTPSDEPGAQ